MLAQKPIFAKPPALQLVLIGHWQHGFLFLLIRGWKRTLIGFLLGKLMLGIHLASSSKSSPQHCEIQSYLHFNVGWPRMTEVQSFAHVYKAGNDRIWIRVESCWLKSPCFVYAPDSRSALSNKNRMWATNTKQICNFIFSHSHIKQGKGKWH